MGGKKKRRTPLIIGILLFIIIVIIPLAVVGLSFIGRITPDSVIPDSFDIYARVPYPVSLAGKVLNHESLPDIMALAELAPLMPPLNQLKNLGITDNKWVRYAAKGRLDAAILNGGHILAAWDAGVVSPLLKILPALAGRITVPNLYYMQAGRNSRFEYRLEGGPVLFIGPYKNLLIVSDNSALFESVLSGTSRDGDRISSGAKALRSRDYDIAFLLSPAALAATLGGSGADAQTLSAINLLQFPGPIEADLSILPDRLRINVSSPLETGNQYLQKIIARNSEAVSLSAMIPANAQYLTLLSAGSLRDLLNGVSAIAAGTGGPSGSGWEATLKKADSSARMTVGMNLDELLYSWTGTQFAVYGLEGRPNPVIAIEIKDEKKRREVFDKAFSSVFLNENIQLNLDGNRIPRIQVPSFLDSLLQLLGVNVPSPYYTVQNNYLLISESAETLLAAVNAVRRNDVLLKTESWRTLSRDNPGPSSFLLFYSLDRSFPFFLKGSSAVTSVLKVYHQGLVQLSLEDRLLRISLVTIPGVLGGIVPVTGYPLDLGAAEGAGQVRAGNRLHRISTGKDTRLILTRGRDVLAVNPLDRTIKTWRVPGSPGAALYSIPFYAIPEKANDVKNSVTTGSVTAGDGAAWIADSRGLVALLNKDLEPLPGFPLNTGIQLSAPPESYGTKLFLCGADGFVSTVDSKAQVNSWGTGFSSALRSPPSFLDFNNKTYAAVYPKSLIFKEIFLLDAEGNPLPRWPVSISGIAFGSPLLFNAQLTDKTERLLTAFITQAGELTILTDNGEPLPGFPLELPGVFYLQPVFDGESLWIIDSDGVLYKVELNGEVLSQKIPRLSVKESAYIAVTALGVDKAAQPDPKNPLSVIILSGEGNALYAYTRHFNSPDGFPLPVWGRPVIGDLDGDGKIEITGIGMDSKLYMWRIR